MTDPWLAATLRRVLVLTLMFALLLAFGVSGYILVQHFTFLEALYMTVITVATVGFQEVRPLDHGGSDLHHYSDFDGGGVCHLQSDLLQPASL